VLSPFNVLVDFDDFSTFLEKSDLFNSMKTTEVHDANVTKLGQNFENCPKLWLEKSQNNKLIYF